MRLIQNIALEESTINQVRSSPAVFTPLRRESLTSAWGRMVFSGFPLKVDIHTNTFKPPGNKSV